MKKIAALFIFFAIAFWGQSDAWVHGSAAGSGGGALRRAQNIFGLQGNSWASFSGNYVPGQGAPAISTADAYHLDGLMWMRPYDLLDSACGTAGAAIAAARGRYFWPASPDHPSSTYGWADAGDFRAGYSNDPGVFPARLETIFLGAYLNTTGNNIASAPVATVTGSISGTSLTVTSVTSGVVSLSGLVTGSGVSANTAIIGAGTGIGGSGTYTVTPSQTVASTTLIISQTNFEIYQAPFFVCNPDDVVTPFYIYAEGAANSIQHEEGFAKSADLLSWTMAGPSTVNPTFTQWSSFQRVKRTGVNAWISQGLKAFWVLNNSPAAFGTGIWSSTDGAVFSPLNTSLMNACIPATGNGSVPCTSGTDREMYFSGFETATIAAQLYLYAKDGPSDGSTSSGAFVTRAPIDANFNVLQSPARVPISDTYNNLYPGPTFLQAVSNYVEDGISHIYAQIGFPPSSSNQGLVNGATYANGGGLWQQGIDYYTEIVDVSVAAAAAPIGVTASAAGGIATISWYDALPNRTYRVYRGDQSSQTTLIGDVNTVTIADAGAPQNQVDCYKVVTLQSGTERKNRVVCTYVSSSTSFVNAHITRALAAGADDATIDRTWLDACDAWLTTNNLQSSLMFWTDPAFGVIKDNSNVISRVMDLGSTRLPRGGDYTPCTGDPCIGASTTTYDAAGMGSNVPAWINANANSFGYYGGPGTAAIPGRINNIRRKVQITLFSSYQKPGTGQITLFGKDEFGGLGLQHTAGTPGTVSAFLSDATHTVTATVNVSGSATALHTAAATFDGTNWVAYSDGVAGTGQTGLVIPGAALVASNDALTGLTAITGANTPFLGSGSQNSKYVYGTGYRFSNNEAQFRANGNVVFEKGLTPTQITSLHTLYTTR